MSPPLYTNRQNLPLIALGAESSDIAPHFRRYAEGFSPISAESDWGVGIGGECVELDVYSNSNRENDRFFHDVE